MKQYLDPNGADFIMKKIRELKNTLLSKLDKSSKATSAEAKAGTDGEKYMTPATTKDAIGQFASKVEVVDNLTTSDSTKALSAKQGKALQDNKANKSDISRCKTKGYGSASSWQSVGNNRDLEDWIGDFDKRTRELKSGGTKSYFKYGGLYANNPSVKFYSFMKVGNLAIFNLETPTRADQLLGSLSNSSSFYPKGEVIKDVSGVGSNGNNTIITYKMTTGGRFEVVGMNERDLWNYSLNPFVMIYETAQ